MKKTGKIQFLAKAALVAAIYVVLTYITAVFGLANGAVQCRLSEALTVLAMFTPAAIPGLFIGCALSNLLTGCIVPDIVFGSIASLIGAVGAYLMRSKHPALATSVNVLSNMTIVPFVLKYAYALEGGFMYFVVTVGLGEIISCTVLGTFLYKVLEKHQRVLFGKTKH